MNCFIRGLLTSHRNEFLPGCQSSRFTFCNPYFLSDWVSRELMHRYPFPTLLTTLDSLATHHFCHLRVYRKRFCANSMWSLIRNYERATVEGWQHGCGRAKVMHVTGLSNQGAARGGKPTSNVVPTFLLTLRERGAKPDAGAAVTMIYLHFEPMFKRSLLSKYKNNKLEIVYQRNKYFQGYIIPRIWRSGVKRSRWKTKVRLVTLYSYIVY